MKKMLTILAVMAMIGSVSAHAAGLGIQYDRVTNTSGTGSANSVTIKPSVDMFGLTVDGLLTGTRAGTTDTSTTAQLRVRKDVHVVGPVSVFGRVGVGSTFATGDVTNFYTINPGVQYAVTPKLTAIAQYTYTNAFTANAALRTNTWSAGASYALTKSDSIEVRYNRILGDQVAHGYTVELNHSF